MSTTIVTSYSGTLTLAPSDNPLTVAPSGSVIATAAGADAIDGGSGINWTVTNSGTVSSTFGYGLNLAGPSIVNNAGSISGVGGVVLSDDGSVSNSAQGVITATGKLPSPLATISAIYVTGPLGGETVSNAGTVTAADGYGIGFGGRRRSPRCTTARDACRGRLGQLLRRRG